MRINSRIRHLEKTKAVKEVDIYIAWPEEDGFMVKNSGEPDKMFTLEEWKTLQEEKPEGYFIEIEWA